MVLEKYLSSENQLPFFEKVIMDLYFLMKNTSLSEGREFGLDTSSVTIEKIPLVLTAPRDLKLKRIEVEQNEDVSELVRK